MMEYYAVQLKPLSYSFFSTKNKTSNIISNKILITLDESLEMKKYLNTFISN